MSTALLPILAIPKIISQPAKAFRSLFNNKRQFGHFQRYLTGLIATDKANVQTINDLFVSGTDQSNLNRFLTQAHWNEQQLNDLRVKLELSRLEPATHQAKQLGLLVIDDTLAHHDTGPNIEQIAYLYDHALKRYTLAHDVVTSYFVSSDGVSHFPIEYRLYQQFQQKKELLQLEEDRATRPAATPQQLGHWQKALVKLLEYRQKQSHFRTKVELAQELVIDAYLREMPIETVLFDSWFLAEKLLDLLDAAHYNWISTAKSDRLVQVKGRYIQLQNWLPELLSAKHRANFRPVQLKGRTYYCLTSTRYFKSVNRKLRLIISFDNADLSGEPLYLVSNRLEWEASRILKTYSLRWPIETFFFDAKQQLGFEDYQLRNLQGIKRHWYLVFVAYSFLSWSGVDSTIGKAIDRRTSSLGNACRATCRQLLRSLVLWLVRQVNQKHKSTYHILKILEVNYEGVVT